MYVDYVANAIYNTHMFMMLLYFVNSVCFVDFLFSFLLHA